MIEKPKRPKKIPNQDNKQPQTIQELIRRYDLDNTKIYDYLDSLASQMNNQIQTIISNQKNNLELIFPIGSHYITQEDINPTGILGFGTWERSKGKVLIGLDEEDTNFSKIGKTGGETTHTLTVNEMPNHNHGFENGNGTAISPTSMRDGGSNELQQGAGSRTYDYIITSRTGGSQPHNNLQPYEVVGYMWIRRA